MARWLVVLAAVAAMMVACSAVAQPPGGAPRGPGGPGGPMMGGPMGLGGGSALNLLRIEQVRKELELLEDQTAKLNELAQKVQAEMRERFAGLRDLDPEQRRAKMEELRGELEKRNQQLEAEVQQILLPHQLTRLEEIRIQLLGLRALQDPKVVKALGITDAQQKQIEEIQQTVRQNMSSLFEQMRGMRDLSEEERAARREEMRKQFEQARTGIEQKVLGVLSAEQKATFEKMKGKPFELDMRALRPGGGPGAPGPGAGAPGAGRGRGRRGGQPGGQ